MKCVEVHHEMPITYKKKNTINGETIKRPAEGRCHAFLLTSKVLFPACLIFIMLHVLIKTTTLPHTADIVHIAVIVWQSLLLDRRLFCSPLFLQVHVDDDDAM